MLLLHISDIHFRSPDCLRPDTDPESTYRVRLIQSARSFVEEADGKADAILISGDLAYKGAPEEYLAAQAWIADLASAVDCPMERVFVVPGNHDFNRGSALAMPTFNAQRAIRDAADKQTELRNQLHDPASAAALMEPLQGYNEFAKNFNCQVYLPQHLSWKQDVELPDGLTLRICGLNSTILSGIGGQDDVRGELYLSPLQTVLLPTDNVIHLVMCHHPPDWVSDQDEVDDAICNRTSIQLFGHKHRQRKTFEQRYARFSAGAVNPDRNEPGWDPGYNFLRIAATRGETFASLSIEAYLMRWQADPEGFAPIPAADGRSVHPHRIERACAITRKTPIVEDVRSDAEKASPPSTDVDASMGDQETRNLVYRFWRLTVGQRREIARNLGVLEDADMALPEPARYGKALLLAAQRNQLSELAREIAAKEASKV